jgi:hypothetical protein
MAAVAAIRPCEDIDALIAAGRDCIQQNEVVQEFRNDVAQRSGRR